MIRVIALSLLCFSFQANASLFDLLQNCVTQNSDVVKSRVSGTSDTVVRVACRGDAARSLYDALRFYSKESEPKKTDTNEVLIYRYFGRESIPSQCQRYIQNSDGSATNRYRCSIGVSLPGDVIKSALMDDVSNCMKHSGYYRKYDYYYDRYNVYWMPWLTKTRVDGTTETRVDFRCSGDVARRLFDNARFYSREYVRQTDTNEEWVVRPFGKNKAESKSVCWRVIRTASGRSTSAFYCALSADLNDDVIKAM